MRTIIALLALAFVASAVPTIFGPAGMPLEWTNITSISSSKFTSPLATSYMTMAGDTTKIVLTGANADRDNTLRFESEDGTTMDIVADDGSNRFKFSMPIEPTSYRLAGDRLSISFVDTVVVYKTSLNAHIASFDPNSSGQGINWLGELGDNDITLFNSQMRMDIVTVDSVHTMGADGTSFYTVTTADSIRCPITPVDGDMFQIKFTNASGGFIKGMGNNIDGSAQVATSEDDNVIIIYNTDSGEWEIR